MSFWPATKKLMTPANTMMDKINRSSLLILIRRSSHRFFMEPRYQGSWRGALHGGHLPVILTAPSVTDGEIRSGVAEPVLC